MLELRGFFAAYNIAEIYVPHVNNPFFFAKREKALFGMVFDSIS